MCLINVFLFFFIFFFFWTRPWVTWNTTIFEQYDRKRFLFLPYYTNIVFAQTHIVYRTEFSCSWGTARRTRLYWSSTTMWPCWTRCRLLTISWERKSIIRWDVAVILIVIISAGWHFETVAFWLTFYARFHGSKFRLNSEIEKLSWHNLHEFDDSEKNLKSVDYSGVYYIPCYSFRQQRRRGRERSVKFPECN